MDEMKLAMLLTSGDWKGRVPGYQCEQGSMGGLGFGGFFLRGERRVVREDSVEERVESASGEVRFHL